MSLFPPTRKTKPPSAAPPRPTQVTRAAIQAIFGSTLVLLVMVTVVSRLHTEEMHSVADRLRKQPMLTNSHLSQSQALDVLRISATVCAAACVAGVVFGVYVLRRHRGSRIGLTVLGGLLFVSAVIQPITGWLIAAYVGLSLYLLWSAPARAWFAWNPGGGPGSGQGSDTVPGPPPSGPPWSGPPPPPPPRR
jgi:hypothetical protein